MAHPSHQSIPLAETKPDPFRAAMKSSSLVDSAGKALRREHQGIDFAAPSGTELCAAGDGTDQAASAP